LQRGSHPQKTSAAPVGMSQMCCHKQTQAPPRTEAVYESRKRAPKLQRRKGRIASRSMLQCFYNCIAKSWRADPYILADEATRH
jgi:hypothetical protein